MAFDWGNNIGQPVEDAIARLDDYNSGIFNAATNPKGLKGGGHISNFPAALTDTATVANGFASFADLMQGYATAAAASALDASTSADKLSGTSTSSVTLSTGSKSFATQAGRSWATGNYLLISSDASPTTHWMVLQVTNYTSTALSGTAIAFSGAGSRADWTIRITGIPGRASGLSYVWSSTTTAADPTAGRIRISSASPAGATSIYISETDADGNAIGPLIATWDDSTSTIKGRVTIVALNAPTNFVVFYISTSITDNGAWDSFGIQYVSSGGTLSDGMQVSVLFVPTGDAGSIGPSGPSYIATSTTSQAIGTGSKAWITQTGLAYQPGTRMRATDAANLANWMEGIVTAYGGGGLAVTVDLTSGSGTIANWNINISGERGAVGAGEAGPVGSQGPAGTPGPTTAPTWVFSSTTSAGASANECRFSTSGPPGTGTLYISELGVDGSNMGAWIEAWDNSTNTSNRGTLFIVQANDPAKYVIFTLGTVTDSGNYYSVACTFVAGPGGFTAGQQLAFAVSVSGNAGAGAGDVVGPASATNNGVVLYDGTTGKLLKSSAAVGSLAYLNSLTKTDVGLGNVDNTSDANKPITTAAQAALDIKKFVSVRLASTVSISISSLTSGNNIDGWTFFTGELILIKNQTSSAENGVYVVGPSPARHTQLDAFADYPGLYVTVQEGNTNADSMWLCTSNGGGTIGSSPLVFVQYGGPSGAAGRAVLAAADTSAVQAGLGLSIGVNVQAYDALLTSIAAQPMVADRILYGTGTDTVALTPITGPGRLLIQGATNQDQLDALGFTFFTKTLIDDPNADMFLTSLGITAAAKTLLDDTSIAAMLTTLGMIGKQAIPIPAGGMESAATNGAATGSVMKTNQKFVTKDFDPTTQETVYFSFRMPQQWDEGPIAFQVVWSHPATITPFGVVFELSAVAVSDTDAGDAAFSGTAVTVTDTGGTTDAIYISPESGAITVAGSPQAGDYVFFRLQRQTVNASDTLAVDARVHELTLYIVTAAGTDV